jgi:Mg-chelatase subunit ChlI
MNLPAWIFCNQVELPLGATEDRICGTIDIEKALSEGIKAYEPGLLVSYSSGHRKT